MYFAKAQRDRDHVSAGGHGAREAGDRDKGDCYSVTQATVLVLRLGGDDSDTGQEPASSQPETIPSLVARERGGERRVAMATRSDAFEREAQWGVNSHSMAYRVKGLMGRVWSPRTAWRATAGSDTTPIALPAVALSAADWRDCFTGSLARGCNRGTVLRAGRAMVGSLLP
jgi:hypothetical protein